MPFCPECRDEFQDWVTVCPDCRVPLVAVLEEDGPETVELEEPHDYLYSNEPMVYVATAPNEAIAGMWAGILESNGIQCVLKSDNLRAAQYSMPQNQFYTIHVLKPVSEIAKRILLPFDEAVCNHPGPYLLPLWMRVCYVIIVIMAAF